mmetsp:Transcript_124077/g.345353  ORF Transcript_124077/g.345353 Transcript_124077/m.345353 type:complete len:210 (-) Transcript_124077:27-656(-)
MQLLGSASSWLPLDSAGVRRLSDPGRTCFLCRLPRKSNSTVTRPGFTGRLTRPSTQPPRELEKMSTVDPHGSKELDSLSSSAPPLLPPSLLPPLLLSGGTELQPMGTSRISSGKSSHMYRTLAGRWPFVTWPSSPPSLPSDTAELQPVGASGSSSVTSPHAGETPLMPRAPRLPSLRSSSGKQDSRVAGWWQCAHQVRKKLSTGSLGSS